MKLSNKQKIELIRKVLTDYSTIADYSRTKAIKNIREIINDTK